MQIVYTKQSTDTIGFFTLTFPNCFNSKTNQYSLDGQYNPYYNDQISGYLDYLTNKGLSVKSKVLKCTGYIWTKELTNELMIHYHVIIRFNGKIQKGTVKKLNDIWGSYTKFNSPNGLRVGQKGFILTNAITSAKYASKYASKSQKGIEKFPSPAHRISNSIKLKPKIFPDGSDSEIDEMFFSLDWKKETEWAIVGKINEKIAKKLFENVDLL